MARDDAVPTYAESIVAALGDGAYVLDTDRNRVFVNDRLREVTGFDEAVLHGKHPERIVAEGHWDEAAGDRFRAATERVLAGESDDERVQLTTRLADGSTITSETRLTPLTADGVRDGNEKGADDGNDATPDEICGVIGVIRDVTDRVERERELSRLNERLERLAAFLSHDLKNPLSVARGYVELTRDTGDVDRLDPADEALERMEALIDEALVLVRDPSAIDVTLEPVDLDALATSCWESGDAGTPPADATLVVEDAGPVTADRALLRRAVGNLLKNAFDHAGDAPTIRVGVDDRGLYVADDGPGIAAADLDEITEFGVSKDGGTGIGLAIVDRVAAAHGWELVVGESDAGGFRATLVGAESTT
ncbi:HAMP domain-containing sensor histidine kinase [Halorubrum halophilum]|uniref:sensor histidine kinase n=1 Tax=Halorubrum halophilum TaxID=413816 RepID=UPI00186B51DD|nr:PAS domain-containing sensor histidine kinase [Halorubrum halophilum]